jgi:fibronectin type 3 domain-containing protein
VRIYAIRGLTKRGRPGPPSTRVTLPLVAPPAAPGAPTATVTEKAIALAWSAPADEKAPVYNVYKRGADTPLNGTPLEASQYERSIAAFGTEECFVVRSVLQVAAIALESAPSDPICVTPRDTFAPAAPKALSIVAGPGTINLSWDANSEPDLGGYVVLRGEAPGETLQPLMAAPIAGTSFEDKAVKPGVRYIYAVVAVDKSAPPNISAQSARIEETAR